MNRAEKTELAKTLFAEYSQAKVAIFADFRGLSASQADELRKLLRPHQAKVRVLKNNIARLMAREGAMGTEVKALMDTLVGPSLVAFAMKDPAAVAKVMYQFAQGNEALKLKESLMGQKRMSALQIEALAQLPSYEVLLATVLGTLQAPVKNFVGVLAAVPRSLVQVLSAIAKKKSEEKH